MTFAIDDKNFGMYNIVIDISRFVANFSRFSRFCVNFFFEKPDFFNERALKILMIRSACACSRVSFSLSHFSGFSEKDTTRQKCQCFDKNKNKSSQINYKCYIIFCVPHWETPMRINKKKVSKKVSKQILKIFEQKNQSYVQRKMAF